MTIKVTVKNRFRRCMAHDVDTGCSKIIRSYDVIRQFLAIVRRCYCASISSSSSSITGVESMSDAG